MGYDEVIKYIFFSLASFVSFDIMSTLRKTKESIESLNIRMATLIEKILIHEKYLDDHAQRIKKIEQQEE